MKKTVFVFGESGRMGQEVRKIVESSDDLEYLGGFSAQNSSLEIVRPVDIVIDFSLPETQKTLIDFAKKQNACVVSGTTGFTKDQLEQWKSLGKSVPTFWAANMSFGVHLMCQLTESLARFEKFFSFHVEETHHIHKVDKPSGTALIVEQAARRSTDSLKPTVSHREGEVFGIHRFIASSKNEQLEIRHDAHNRSLFAQGAVDVARWLVLQKAGLYEMDDFFNQFEA